MLSTSSEGRVEVPYVRRHLIAVLVAALMAGALTLPASALAGGSSGGGSGASCTAELTSTQDVTVASFSVECGEANPITAVRLETSESGSVEGNTGTECTAVDSTTFDCAPTPVPDSLVTGRFENARGQEVCADPRLTVDFTIEFEDGPAETIEDFEITGCDDTGGDDGDTGGDESGDEGSVPDGGIDSGRGRVESASGSALPLPGAILAVLCLAGGGLLMRRSRKTG